MKTILTTTILAATLIASRAFPGDVAYQLDMPKLEATRASDDAETAAVEVVERAWAAPGVEQSDYRLPPADKFDFTASSQVRRIQFPGDGPYWLDDVIWPRTRAMFHLAELLTPARFDSESKVFTFALGGANGVTLYR